MQFNKETVLVCDCGNAMIPNISTGDEDGYGWICLNPSCAEFNGAELASEDLEALGVPSWVAQLLGMYFEHLEEATPERPRLATYYILTGEKYWVEATSEEEALANFTEEEAEYIEADTVVVGHD